MKKFEVDFFDRRNDATSAIDIVYAEDGYTAEMYVKDCYENADFEWIEMLKNGDVTIAECE